MNAVVMLPCGPDYLQDLMVPIVLQDVENQFGVSAEDLRGVSKSEKFVLPRHVVMLSLISFGVSNAAAARVVGRDYSAATYAMNRQLGRTPRNAKVRRAVQDPRERVFKRLKSS